LCVHENCNFIIGFLYIGEFKNDLMETAFGIQIKFRTNKEFNMEFNSLYIGSFSKNHPIKGTYFFENKKCEVFENTKKEDNRETNFIVYDIGEMLTDKEKFSP